MLTIISVYFEYLIVAVVPFYSNSKNAKKSGKCSAKYWVDIFLQWHSLSVCPSRDHRTNPQGQKNINTSTTKVLSTEFIFNIWMYLVYCINRKMIQLSTKSAQFIHFETFSNLQWQDIFKYNIFWSIVNKIVINPTHCDPQTHQPPFPHGAMQCIHYVCCLSIFTINHILVR